MKKFNVALAKRTIEQEKREILRALTLTSGPGMHNLSPITSNIYISNRDKACDIDELLRAEISAVLSVTTVKLPSETLAFYRENRIAHLHVRIEDAPTEDLSRVTSQCYEFIHNQVSRENHVLVHCDAGISRSATIVASYYLFRYYLTNHRDAEALAADNFQVRSILLFIKEFRACIMPNPGFINQLLLIELGLKQHYWQIHVQDLSKRGICTTAEEAINKGRRIQQLCEEARFRGEDSALEEQGPVEPDNDAKYRRTASKPKSEHESEHGTKYRGAANEPKASENEPESERSTKYRGAANEPKTSENEHSTKYRGAANEPKTSESEHENEPENEPKASESEKYPFDPRELEMSPAVRRKKTAVLEFDHLEDIATVLS